MKTETLLVCPKCGRTATYSTAVAEGWLIGQRKGQVAGYLVIRCPEHTTRYAAQLIGPAKMASLEA